MDVAHHRLFSSTFEEARQRFVDAGRQAGARLLTYPMTAESARHHTAGKENLGAQKDLSMDVAIWGNRKLPTVVLSSGIHGVEGFFGSAVQLGVLQRLRSVAEPTVRYVMIHALNPYGFAHLRRCNEDNVDLNRNFLHGEGYSGSPLGYAELDGLLNPTTPPSSWEPFYLKAWWQIARGGLASLKEAVARGQYDFPLGLFYGGAAPCWSTRTIKSHCQQWIDGSEQVLHLDFHSGLGAHGKYRLLTNERIEAAGWYIDAFGGDVVESLVQPGGTAYPITGLFGDWMQRFFQDRVYRFAGAEFGTYGILRVLAAIRAENRAEHYCSPQDPRALWAKRELMECFCPRSLGWRRQVVASALRIVEQAARALQQTNAGQLKSPGLGASPR